jgi:hypothetical protein
MNCLAEAQFASQTDAASTFFACQAIDSTAEEISFLAPETQFRCAPMR